MMLSSWNRRRRARGVAMVEAGILAPIFAMMMMLTVYLMGIYETKYRTHMMSRYATWSLASNACQTTQFNPIYDQPAVITNNGASQSSESSGNTNDQSSLPPGDGNYTNQAQGGAQASASLDMAHGKSTMTWDYSPTYRFNSNKSKQITTESYCLCNEPPPQGGVTGIFSYIGSILSDVNL